MKQPEYNEIDSLLRSWAGRNRSVSGEAARNSAGAHLDADELSSYAEGVLPPATRARYTSHLVDCDDCRKVVTESAVAAGPKIKESLVESTPELAGWRKALAAFLSPAVMRFALPALALVVVGVVFFTYRSANDRALEAVTNPTSQATTPAPNATAGFQPSNDSSAQVVTKAPRAEADSTAANKEVKAGEKAQAQATPDSSTASGVAATIQPEEPKKERAAESTREEQANVVAERRAIADAPPPPAKPAAVASSGGGPKDSKELAKQPAGRDKEDRKREADYATDSVATAGAPMSAKDSSKNDDDRQKTKSLAGARANSGRHDEAEETRNIAGRHFSKQDGVWVDSAYKSSMSAMKVKRGSDQYRALVADEPEIGSIANQLKGEVLLVWKGRAYHIQ
jgi:hypothetical protein